MVRTRDLTWFTLLVVSFARPLPVIAQAITGRVTDETTGGPLELAEVVLLSAEGRAIASEVTDSTGTYEVRAPEPGEYRVRVDLLGYRRLESPLLALPDGRTVAADFELPTSPVEIEGIRVEAEALERIEHDLRMYGIRRAALGERFVGPEELRQRPTARDFGRVLQWQSIPNLSIVHWDDLGTKPPKPFICVQARRGLSGCAVVVLNGARVPLEVGYDVPKDALRAVVVLTPVEATLLYGTAGTNGAVLLFTR